MSRPVQIRYRGLSEEERLGVELIAGTPINRRAHLVEAYGEGNRRTADLAMTGLRGTHTGTQAANGGNPLRKANPLEAG
jgi:hypothetical protein